MPRPFTYDWKIRWRKDLTQIVIHIAEGFRAIENDNFDGLEDAVSEIESLVESHA
uniref:Uncharacterized protein n=1 Tax=viral metagenome TaxID=1070528 RepID=A0A6M3LTT6_9ZZZZ